MPIGYRLLLCCLLLLTLIDVTNAQRLNNQWRFGDSGGLDFNGAVPVAAPGSAITPGEGHTAVSDPTSGQLLFYTNGVTVWNRNNQVMLNGDNLDGGRPNSFSSTTAAVICPRPGSTTQYYIFTIDEEISSRGLKYSLVDMSLAGGLGGIVAGQKNIFLFQANNEKLQIIPHSNGISLWVLTHTFPNIFAAFLVDATGVTTVPVLSTLGNPLSGTGFLKVNRQFTQLAMGNNLEEDIEMFDFDRSTGLVSNFRRWAYLVEPQSSALYGFEFSPDGTKLYVSNLFNVYQYNLQAGNLAAIAASATLLGGTLLGGNFPTCLQLGPDDKIYVGTSSTVTDRINFPNALGNACNFVTNPIPNAGGGGLGLHNWVYRAGDLPFSELERIELLGDSCDLSQPLQFRAVGNSTATRYFWQFNDPTSSSDTLSTSAADSVVSHRFSGPGTYRICIDYAAPGQVPQQLCQTFLLGNCCRYSVAITDSCLEEPFAINLRGTVADSVRWIFGGNETLLPGNVAFEPNIPIAGNYSFTAVVFNSNCDIDTLEGSFVRKDCNLSRCTFFAANVFTPQGDGINDTFKPMLACVPQFYEFFVYNRWGQELFRTNLPEQGWDGRFRGELCEPGTYQYLAFFRFDAGETQLKSGSFKLLR
ncbi:MAG: hypothetical protein C0424_05620 [Sphingobacteriaceae bacterium]|nr:hypothetical protein [Sphingobacteriaceae bacterium]